MKAEYLLLGIVLIVGLAGLASNNATGNAVIRGGAHDSFARPLGTHLEQLSANPQCYIAAEGSHVCCYPNQGRMVCITGEGKSFGPNQVFREGGQKTYASSPSKPGVILG